MPNQAEANLSALIESTEDLIWSVDLDYRLINFNRAMQRTIETGFGIRVEPGMNREGVLPPEMGKHFPPLYARALSQGPFRTEYILRDGRTLELSFNPIVVDGHATGVSVFGKDITERKMAEQASRQIADSLAEAQMLGGLGSYHLDIPAGVWASSPVLDEIFGIDKQFERNVASWAALIHPDDRAMMDAYLAEEVLGKGKEFNQEYRIQRQSDGAERWVHGMGKLVFDDQGRPLRMHGVIKDITERKRSEILLRASEERYRTTFEMSVDAVNINRLCDGVYVDCNKSFLDITGYDRQEVIGESSLQLNIWADPNDRLKLTEALRAHSVCRNLEAQFRKKDGTLLWGLMSASLIDFDGVPCVLSVTRDISEIKAADQRLADAAEALRASEERYRATFQASIDAININRLSDGVFVDANEAFLRYVGFGREEVIGRTSLELGFWADAADRQKMLDTLRRDSIVRDLEARFRKKNGEIAWGQMSGSLLEVDGEPCILSVTRDITAAKAADELLARAQDALLASEARYRTVFQTSADSVTITHLDSGQYVDVNQAFLDTTGFNRDEVIDHTALEINLWADPRDRKNFAELLRQQLHCQNLETRFRKKNGEIFSGLVSAAMIELDGVPCIVSFLRDISGLKAAADKIRDLAFYDPLTHLPNRRLLMERVRQTLAAGARSNRKCALLIIDLDHFKILNDTLGHETGDLMLQETALRLTTCIHDADTVARQGGDEFVVMLENLSETPEEAAAQAEAAGESILAAINQPYLLGDREYRSTASIGITVFGDHRENANDLMQQADIAMYQAKTAGRNTSRFFAPALQAAVHARAALEEDLRQAIEGNQFVLYYQPQVDAGGLIGAEALIRWNHPRRGLLPPGEFISLAEETGLILPLGEWVLENACIQIAAWALHSAAPISIAVNISARQFRQPDFVEQVLAVLKRTGANPQHLDLELTESMLLENVEDVIAKMTLLESHGLHFSLDDFGTGYSSLSYLKRLPLDQLKIDRSFVQDILEDIGSRAIAQSVISLGRALGLAVIAEGVETTEQRDLLTGHGCYSFQGYLYSRPLPLGDFQRLWLDAPERAVPTR